MTDSYLTLYAGGLGPDLQPVSLTFTRDLAAVWHYSVTTSLFPRVQYAICTAMAAYNVALRHIWFREKRREHLKGGDHLEDLDMDRIIILK
jgi:hypothetical protein